MPSQPPNGGEPSPGPPHEIKFTLVEDVSLPLGRCAGDLVCGSHMGTHARRSLPTIFSIGNNLASLEVSEGDHDSDKQNADIEFSVQGISTSCGNSDDECHCVSICASSKASSNWQYAEPTQTLIFLDWDDTLFPTTDLLNRWRVPQWQWQAHSSLPLSLPPELERRLELWREAVYQYLCIACSLSDRCVIVTNAKRPWVTDCINRFAPNLRPLFDKETGGLQVAYADEALMDEMARTPSSASRQESNCSGCMSGIAAWWRSLDEEEPTVDEQRKKLTAGKHAAMKREAHAFYSRYPGQTWKNILSVGDMRYEYDAVQGLSSGRSAAPARERLRTKAIVIPANLSLSQLTLQLQISRLLLPAYVLYDGDIDLDLCVAPDPLGAVSEALGVSQLGSVSIPRPVWGGRGATAMIPRTTLAEDEEAAISEALDELAVVVHDALTHGPLVPATCASGGSRRRSNQVSEDRAQGLAVDKCPWMHATGSMNPTKTIDLCC